MSGNDIASLSMDLPEASTEQPEIHDFTSVYQAWFRTVHRWIRALAGPGTDAEDLAQEVFMVVQRKLARFDGTNFAGWLYVITQHQVAAHRRCAWFRNIFSRPRDVTLDNIASFAASSDDQVGRMEEERQLYQIIQQLNPRWRNSFLLFEVAGLSGEEIARLQQMPAATVRTHLFRARKEFLAFVAKLQAEDRP